MKVVTPEISWHNRDPVYSVDLQPSDDNIRRVATCGTDKLIRMWSVKLLKGETNASSGSVKERGCASVEFLSTLNRHSRTVNVVRFSPDGAVLASGGDDSAIILWKLSDIPPSNNLFQEDEEENRETWTAYKILRSHLEDVYDLSWSSDSRMLLSGSVDNTAILWDIKKGHKLWMFSEHKSFVQGVALDPLSGFLATLCDDRSLRIYNFEKRQLVHDVRKLPSHLTAQTDPVPSLPPAVNKTLRLFHSSDTMKSFFRRLSFSPDGQLLVAPAGCIEAVQSVEPVGNTTYIFSRCNLSKPVVSLTGSAKPTIAVRFCPVLFELRQVHACNKPPSTSTAVPSENNNEENDDEPEWSKYETMFKLPYRMIFAVVSENALYLYDTQQPQPFAYLTNLHYHTHSDATWSQDGRILILASTDGYCTIISFDTDELGKPYKHQLPEVSLMGTVLSDKGSSVVAAMASCDPIEVKLETASVSVATPIDSKEQPTEMVNSKTSVNLADVSKVDQAVASSQQKCAMSNLQPKVKVRRIQTTQLTLSGTAPTAATPATCSSVVPSTPSTATLPSSTVDVKLATAPPVNSVANFFKKPAVNRVLTAAATESVTGSSLSSAIVVSDDSQEPMDTTPAVDEPTDESMKVDDRVGDCVKKTPESAELNLVLELTNDACSVAHCPSSLSVESAPKQPPVMSVSSSTSSASNCQKNPRRIQLTTITKL